MKVVFVVGPTASGKSARTLRWAKKWGGVIVNCDSVQCYQSVNIGSAKPSLLERKLVPHHLFDYIPEGETLTAGAFSRDFFALITKLAEENVPVAFVVGGTGFYFQAIEKGMYSVGAADAKMISQLEAEIKIRGARELWQELADRDPETAQRISLQDHYRIVRAVEMIRTHGTTPSEVKSDFEKQQKPFPYPLLKLGIKAQREELEPKVRTRTRKMFEQGLLEEVKALMQKGLSQWSPLSSVGYKECIDYFTGNSAAKDLTDLEALIVTSTLQLAKKQRTWFQRDPEIRWLPISGESAVGDDFIQEFLY